MRRASKISQKKHNLQVKQKERRMSQFVPLASWSEMESRKSSEDDELHTSLIESQLMKAIVSGKLDRVKECYKEDPGSINWQSGWNESTPLMVAVSLPYRADIVRFLIDNGADLNLTNKLKNTAVMIAAETGHFEYVRILVEESKVDSRPNLKAQNAYGQTALHLAIEAYDNKVEAKHPEKGERLWFPAKVEKENGDNTLHIVYEDYEGEPLAPQLSLENHLVRSRRKNLHFLQVGYTIEMRYSDDLEWHKGTIVRDRNDGTFDVQCMDGTLNKKVRESSIYSIEETLRYNRCFDIFVYLATKERDLLKMKNKYHKEAMLVASEFGKLKVVEWILENHEIIHEDIKKVVNTTETDGNTALMYALSGTSNDHTQIARLLLDNHADYKRSNVNGLSTLYWAVDGGNVYSTKALISRAQRDDDGDEMYDKKAEVQNTYRTALMHAVAQGKYDICKAVVEGMKKVDFDGKESKENFRKRMDRMWMVDTEDGLDAPGCMNAMQIALRYGHVKIATDLFMVVTDCKNWEYSMLFCNANDVFRDRGMLTKMAIEMANKVTINNLMNYAVRYDFHFDLFISLIPLFPSPLTVLTDALPRFFNLFATDARGSDQNILHRMVLLYTAIKSAVEFHPLEATDLTVYMERLDTMISTICTNDTLADVKKLHAVLCYPSKKNMNMEEFKDQIVNLVHSFRYGPLDHCVDNHVLSVFGNGRITTFVNNLFHSYLRKRTDDEMEVPHFLGKYHRVLNRDILTGEDKNKQWSVQSESLRKLESNLIYLRYNPSMMFYLEGLCKLFYLVILIILVLRFGDDINGKNFFEERIARAFGLFTVSTIIFEYGELCGNQFRILPRMDSIMEYFQDNWNQIDGCGLSCVIAAYGFLLNCALIPESQRDGLDFKRSEDTGKFLLSVSCIFFSSGILRSMYWYEDLGKLVIITFGISGNIASWFVLSAMLSVGFCIYYVAMHRDLENFESTFQAIVTIFDHLLMNFDAPTETFGVGTAFREYAVVINLSFLVIFGVILLNLIIARMGSVYEDLEAKSFQEFQYQKADLVNQYSLIEERSPCCMLPAPFNVIPVLFSVFDIVHIMQMTEEDGGDDKSLHTDDEEDDEKDDEDRIEMDPTPFLCFSGTAANVTIAVIMSFFGPVVELFKYILNLFVAESLFEHGNEVFYFLILWPLHYSLFLLALLHESLFLRSEIKYVPSDKDRLEYKYMVHFDTDQQCKAVPAMDDPTAKGPWMSIKVLNAECHQASPSSNPIVQIRLGDMQVETNESIFGGKTPKYTNQEFFFPLGDVDITESGVFKIVVLDRSLIGVDKVLGEFSDDGDPVMDDEGLKELLEGQEWECFKKKGIIKQWLADGRFEGKIPLENAMGSVNIVVKTDFMTHLQVYNDGIDPESRPTMWQTATSNSDPDVSMLRKQTSKRLKSKRVLYIPKKVTQIGAAISSGNLDGLDLSANLKSTKNTSAKKKSFPSYFQLSDPLHNWLKDDLEQYNTSLLHSSNNESLNLNWGELLNEASSEGFEELFDKLDGNEDADGKITLDELRKGLLEKGCPVFAFFVNEPVLFTPDEIKDMMIQAFGRDKGDVGDLSIEILNTAGPYPRLKELFARLDKDGDKGISLLELRAGMSAKNVAEDDSTEDSLKSKLENIENMLSRMGTSISSSASLTYESKDIEVANLKVKLNIAEEKLEKMTEGMLQANDHEIVELRRQNLELQAHCHDNDNIIEEYALQVENLEIERNSMQEENEKLLREVQNLKSQLDTKA